MVSAYGNFICSKGKPLPKHGNVEPVSGYFKNSSVVEMLLYLAGHMILIALQNVVHKHALEQIGHYLKAWADKGLITSQRIIEIDSFPDSDFTGIYGHKAMNDPDCVEIRTGYVIMVLLCDSLNCNLRQICLLWKLRVLLLLITVLNCFSLQMESASWLRP